MLLLLQLLETLPLLEGEETIEEREGSDPVRSICFANDASTSANPLKYPMSISQDTCALCHAQWLLLSSQVTSQAMRLSNSSLLAEIELRIEQRATCRKANKLGICFPTNASQFNSDCVSTTGAGTGWYIGMETWSSLLPSGRPSFHTDTDTDANHCGLQDRT